MINYPKIITIKKHELAEMQTAYRESPKDTRIMAFFEKAILGIKREIKHYENKLTKK